MDRYAPEMIAGCPALADDSGTPAGSVHIVGLPDPAAAHAFACGISWRNHSVTPRGRSARKPFGDAARCATDLTNELGRAFVPSPNGG